MKKIKVFSAVLLGSLFGLTSCELPEFVSKIPGVSKLVSKQEEKKDEENKQQEENNQEENAQKEEKTSNEDNNSTENTNEENNNQNTNNNDNGSDEDVQSGSYVISFKKASKDGSKELNASEALARIDKGSEYVQSVSSCSKIYESDNGLKFGNSSNPGSITFSLKSSAVSQTITSIELVTKEYSSDKGNFNVSINGNALSDLITPSEGGTISNINEKATTLKIETTLKRAYLSSIILNYGKGGSSTNNGGGEENTVHSMSEIVADINEALAVVGNFALTYYNTDKFVGWYLGVSLGDSTDDSETNLKSAADQLASYLPDYLESDGGGYFPEDEEDSAEYDLYFINEDASICVDVIGYIEEGELCAEIQVYEAELDD